MVWSDETRARRAVQTPRRAARCPPCAASRSLWCPALNPRGGMVMAHVSHSTRRPMNVYVRRGSTAETKYRTLGGIPGLLPDERAPGIPPTPAHDLLFHGGKTIEHLTFTNLYVGGDTWQPSDMTNIDRALAAAMAEPHLNNVMAQYFAGRPPTTTFRPSQTLPGPAPHTVSQGDVEQLVRTLVTQNRLSGFDVSTTVF